MRLRHPAPSSKQGEIEEIGNLAQGADCDVEVVGEVLASQVGLEAVEGDILDEGEVREGCVKEVEVAAGDTQGAITEDAVGKVEIAADLAVAGAGAEAIVEVFEIDSEVGPVMGGKGLGGAGSAAMFADESLNRPARDGGEGADTVKPAG